MESQGISKRMEGKLKLGSVTSFEPRHQPRADSEGPAVHPLLRSLKLQALLVPEPFHEGANLTSHPSASPSNGQAGDEFRPPPPALPAALGESFVWSRGPMHGVGSPSPHRGNTHPDPISQFPDGAKPSEGQSPQDGGSHYQKGALKLHDHRNKYNDGR